MHFSGDLFIIIFLKIKNEIFSKETRVFDQILESKFWMQLLNI